MTGRTFTAGAVQFDIVNGDITGNMEKAFALLDGLAARGTDLAVLPEMVSCGFDNERIRAHARHTPDILGRLARYAGEKSMGVAGSFPQADGDRVFNTLYFIDRDGSIKEGYRKLHLFRLTREHEFYTPGRAARAIDTSFGRIGLMICYDLRFPELARQLFLDRAVLFIVSAQWPSARLAHWQALALARAIENQSYFICSNRTGSDGELSFPGGSTIVDPLGNILAQAGAEEGSVTARIDMAEIDRARDLIPIEADRRKDIYG